MISLKYEHLFDISLSLQAIQDIGTTPVGMRRIVPVAGGTFKGERLTGDVLANAAADWVLVRGDGSVQLDVRLTLQTDDDQLIYMTYRGIRNSTPEVAKRLASGESVDPKEYYFRTTPMFETASERYAWMNNIVSVGVGERLATGVKYRVFEIL